MQKNWYVVYTKPKCEKKVAGLLTKKKIETFCPLNCKPIRQFRKTKLHYEPLFRCYVFALVEESCLSLLKQVENVVNLVYWKGEPAIINPQEIESIKNFTRDYSDVKLERTNVNGGDASVADSLSYTIDGKILIIKNKSVKVNLPSLGFTLIAEMERENVMGREVLFGNKELSFQ